MIAASAGILKMRKSLLKLVSRSFHSTRIARIDTKNVEEVRIPVPWGHIAGRWWGSKDGEPIVALHGWLDNAGSWEPLLKSMPEEGRPVLAIDFPGGGLSSHMPRFLNYHFVDTAYVIQLIKDHLGLGPLTILAHSGGSATGFVYSSVFPENVRGYFGIDYVLQAVGDQARRAEKLGPALDRLIQLALREAGESKSYEKEELKRLWSESTSGSVSPASAEILMKRGVQETPDGKFVFTRDFRVKGEIVEAWSATQVESLARNLRCHVALVKALQSPLFDKGLRNCPRVLGVIEENAKSFRLHEVDGGHHVHMDKPELILPLFFEFLERL